MVDQAALRALRDALVERGYDDADERVDEVPDSGRLDLSFNSLLRAIPPEVFRITDLESLVMTGVGLAAVPAEIGRLKNLVHLDVTSRHSLRISPHIGRLSRLESLSLGADELDLPAQIGTLPKLNTLTLWELDTFPDWLFDLRQLEYLWLSGPFTSVPDRWDELTSLYYLTIRNTGITSVPESVGRLSQLLALDLGGGQLTDLPMALAGLTELKSAHLGRNNFEKLPDVVTRWRNLEVLDLLSDPAIHLTLTDGVRLTTRPYVRQGLLPRGGLLPGEGLTSLPRELAQLPELKVLLLHGNPQLGLPEELLGEAPVRPGRLWDKSVKEILDYYFRSLDEARPLNEAKLVLVGWGGVGKTSLVKRLLHDEFESGEPRTEGIEVSNWSVDLDDGERARLNVWDFGGQEIMHATHQFFLTTRALYVLVLTGRSGSADSDAEYWLRVVSNFAAGSPIVIVLNQIDLDPFELDETGLRRRFPDIKAFIRTDCASATGIDHLRAEILRQTSDLPDLRVSFPASWFSIKDRLAAMDENYLTFETYRRICADLGESESQAQDRLANYLHSLGIALNYRDDPRLRDTHVLNPHWVTEGIYTILNSRLVGEQHGEVATSQLAEILDLDRYPVERHPFLLDLMRKFELCFPFAEQEDRFLIADLLPKQQPGAADGYAEGLRFEYRYPVLPEGLLPRFIVRTHVLSSLRWRSGCVLSWEGNHALVRADAADRCVRIWVSGPADGRRRLLAVVRSDLDHIHRGYRFKVEAWVPVENSSILHEELLAAEKAGLRTLPKFIDGQMVTVNVADLLHGVDLPKERAKRAARVFLSYSHRDERQKDELVTHLKVLQSAGLVDVWHDRRIDPGADWATEIDDALRTADIALFLVSANFFGSDYCQGVEVTEALRRRESGELAVVPVIIKDVNWRSSRMSGLQAVPTDGKPIATWKNRDTAWRIVSEEIEKLAREQREKS